MKFDLFLENVPKIQNVSLPATESHLKMAPMNRVEMLKLWDYSKFNPKKAGVLSLLYPKHSQAYLVLIIRTARGIHSSQVAFPGGQYETEDMVLANTAKRETFEEIGVYQEKINIIKDLSEIYIPPSNFLVYPFLGYTNSEPQFILAPDEVAQIIEVPLIEFLHLKITNHDIKANYSHFMNVPAYNIGGNIVWGATAMILSELKDVLVNGFKSQF